jgi:hypothetical protein
MQGLAELEEAGARTAELRDEAGIPAASEGRKAGAGGALVRGGGWWSSGSRRSIDRPPG